MIQHYTAFKEKVNFSAVI